MAKISAPSHAEDHSSRHLLAGGDPTAGTVLGDQGVIYFAADQHRNNSNTLANDDYFVIPLVSNGIYTFNAKIILTTTTSSSLKWIFTGPSSFSGTMMYAFKSNSSLYQEDLDTEGSASIANTADLTVMFGTVINSSTAGDLVFQWSQYTAVSENTTIHKGSSIIWTRLV